MQKTLETAHIKVVIADSTCEKLKCPKEGELQASWASFDDEKLVIYLNTEYYNTKEALEYGISSNITSQLVSYIIFHEIPEEEADKLAFMVGEELVDIKKQI